MCWKKTGDAHEASVLGTVILRRTLLAGCAPRLQKPEISLAGIDLVGLGLFEQRFVLKLRIRNPNDVDLPVNALNFDVEFNARHFARGVSDKPVIIPRQGETILEVKTVSRLGDVLKPLRDAQKSGREPDRLPGIWKCRSGRLRQHSL